MNRMALGIGLLWLVSSGCEPDRAPISMETLAGKIGGNPWTFVAGQTSAALSTGIFFTTLYASAFPACEQGAAPFEEDHFIIALPKRVGAFDLSAQMSATFIEGATAKNRVVTMGNGVIDSITETTITGGLNVPLSPANTIDGRFQVTICPKP
jgi:hypothetical protein